MIPHQHQNETVNIIFPSITYNAITAGASYCLGKISLDFGFEYLSGEEREIPFGTAYEMPGTHGMNIIAASFGLTYSVK